MAADGEQGAQAKFRAMTEGTKEDWTVIATHAAIMAAFRWTG